MADSILRLKVESSEYDNKLKQAANGLTRYADECRKAGRSVKDADKDTVEYVRALGQMEATSRTATGKLAEMRKTIVELSAQYKQMTDEEKQSPFGKAMAKSLDELKGRFSENKKEIDDINKSLNGGGGGLGSTLDSITGKFGISIQSLAGWGTALAAAKGALDVMKDAFFASEANVDEWGRVMDSSKSLYEGFLNALNTGDISGYLGRIDQIVTAARAAYNELDRLGTMRTIQAPQISAQQTENDRLRMMIQTGRYIAPLDGRASSMQNGQILTPTQIKILERQLQNGANKLVGLIGNEVKQTSNAIDAVYRRQGAELGISVKEFRKGTSSMAEFDKRIKGAENYQKWQAAHTTIDISTGREIAPRYGNPYAQYKGWDVFRVDGERYNQLVQLIQQRDQQAARTYGMQSQAYRTMNRAEGITLRNIMGGGRAGGGGGGGRGSVSEITYATTSIAAQEKKVSDLTKAWRECSEELRDGYKVQLDEAKKELAIMQNPAKAVNTAGLVGLAGASISGIGGTMDVPDKLDIKTPLEMMNENLKRLIALRDNAMTSDEYRAYSKAVKRQEGDISNFKGEGGGSNRIAEDIGKMTEQMNQVTNGIGNITGGLAQLGVDIPEGFNKAVGAIQAVSTILTGIATIVTLIKGEQTVQTTASWIDALIPFSRGGVVRAAGGYIVPGNFGYDAVPSLLTSGEVVLNRAQTNALASQLQEGERRGGGNGMARVSGEQIYIAVNNFLRRSGRGELVTWR